MKDPKADLEHEMREIVKQSLISDAELNETTREEMARIKKCILEPDEAGKRLTEWRPQITFVSHKDPTENKRKAGIFLIANLPENFRDRVHLFEKAGDHASAQKDFQCVAAFFSTEVWFTQPTKAEVDSNDFIMPSKSPDRKEGILAHGITIDGRMAGMTHQITREGGNPDGRIIEIADCGMDTFYGDGDKNKKIESNLMSAFFRGYVLGRVKRGPFKDQFFNEDGSRKEQPGDAPSTGKWKKRF